MEVLSIQNQFQYAVEDWPTTTATASVSSSAAAMPNEAVPSAQKPYDRQPAAKLPAKQKSPAYGQQRRPTFNYNNNNNNNNNNSVYLTTTLAAATKPVAQPASLIASDDVDSDGGATAPTFCCQLNSALVQEISLRLQSELRMAKNRHLTCTEVSLPWELTPRIAVEIIKISEREPCGVRGSTIFIEFEHEPNQVRRIASFKVDPNTLSTFELCVTLKQDKSGWISRLPQFLKNLTRSSTILISSEFTITKNKLYSCE